MKTDKFFLWRFATHLENQMRLFGGSINGLPDNIHPDTRRHIDIEARYDHLLSVFNPLRDLAYHAIQLTPLLQNKRAGYFTTYGVGRRATMMFSAYQELTGTAFPQRTQALSHKETQALTVCINTIYINIRGCLDNLAWALGWELVGELMENINPLQIGLFDQRFRKHFTDKSPFAGIDSKTEWINDLKSRRDPVAHRIPLYVVSAILEPREAEEYNRLSSLHIQEAGKLNFDASKKAFQDIDELGVYPGYIVHDPTEKPIEIYPTVVEDIGHMLEIADNIFSAMGYSKSLLPT